MLALISLFEHTASRLVREGHSGRRSASTPIAPDPYACIPPLPLLRKRNRTSTSTPQSTSRITASLSRLCSFAQRFAAVQGISLRRTFIQDAVLETVPCFTYIATMKNRGFVIKHTLQPQGTFRRLRVRLSGFVNGYFLHHAQSKQRAPVISTRSTEPRIIPSVFATPHELDSPATPLAIPSRPGSTQSGADVQKQLQRSRRQMS